MQNLHHTEAEHCQIGMYDSSFEHDNCGIGAVVNIKGIKSHGTVDNALKIVVLVYCCRYHTSSLKRQ